jgi:hypothetical protein
VSRIALIQAASFTVVTVTIAAWLLRRRELAADSQVLAVLGSPGALRRWLSSGRGRRRWAAAVRRASLGRGRAKAAGGVNAGVVLDGGLVYALVVGAVTALAMPIRGAFTWRADFAVATGIIHASETYVVVYAGHTLILLGKESVDNIVAFRFANGLFEPVWNRQYIRYVQIDVPEKLSIEGAPGRQWSNM